MPLSYQLHTTSTTTAGPFSFAQIDGYLSIGHIKVFINDAETVAFTVNEPTKQITLNSAVAAGTAIRIQRVTPNTEAERVIDFTDGSVLTAEDLDKSARQTLFIIQEAEDTGSGGLSKNAGETAWDAAGLRLVNLNTPTAADHATNKSWVESHVSSSSIALTGSHWNANNRRIQNLASPTDNTDAVTRGYVDGIVFQGDGFAVPQTWVITSNGGTSYTLPSPIPFGTDSNMFLVEAGGIIQNPANYNIVAPSTLQFTSNPPPNGVQLIIRNFGYARNVATFNDAVTFGSGISVTGNAGVTGTVSATGFSGPLTGNVTGNVNGNVTGNLSGTVQTASQTNITSVGTLGSLAVTGNTTVDTDTLVVNASTDRVGINVAVPTVDLDVAGSAKFGGNVDIAGTISAANLASLAGGLKQVVSMTTSTQTTNNTLNTYTDATDLLLSITPTSATSRLIILATVNASIGTPTTWVGAGGVSLKIQGGTGPSPTSWSDVRTYGYVVGVAEANSASSGTLSSAANVLLFHITSPGTTATVTYKIQLAPVGTSSPSGLNAGVNFHSTAVSGIMLIEIGV
jgi:hypothetical protein